MIDYRNRTALVTGASSGIGKAFAEALAGRGASVLLAARSGDKLAALAREITRAHGVDARPVEVDLSTENGPDHAFEKVRGMGLAVDILVNNAGYGTHGGYDSLPADRDHREVMLNVAALERLTHLAVPGMLARGWGIVVNVASTAAFQPLPYMAVYGATKAFVLSFSQALWGEYRGKNIRVLAVCPGATETDFFHVLGTEQAAMGKKRTPQQVVSGALKALERGRPCVIDGAGNFLAAQSIRLAPRRAVILGASAVMRPRPPR
jgi:uncharacterized protein